MVLPANGVPALKGTVADMLARKGNVVHSIEPGATVFDAVFRMDERRVGALVVLEGGRLAGILSERDYTRKVILRGRASREMLVREIMTSAVVSVAPATTLEDCLRTVTQYGIRHLPVVDGDSVVGVLSIGDLVRAVVEQQAERIESLHTYISSDYPK